MSIERCRAAGVDRVLAVGQEAESVVDELGVIFILRITQAAGGGAHKVGVADNDDALGLAILLALGGDGQGVG